MMADAHDGATHIEGGPPFSVKLPKNTLIDTPRSVFRDDFKFSQVDDYD